MFINQTQKYEKITESKIMLNNISPFFIYTIIIRTFADLFYNFRQLG